ncbi:AtpZ/AtpI family protein [Brumimicrobium aurantiacum]|uniref:AtpZ/AtpI family protein n=1 Tax=Brumimicrobium aurantiacum TaxID=1737063 RepID=A0A3E1EXY5_9FLAO|nr:AtpZ/AtpI family protein [Brumimicrobium aurantiacum]RFC54397.1 AtpZ/AtpI family protein [Brumimicrobium aurantiacum]
MKDKKENKKRMNNYVRFSSVAIQMGIVITIAALGGDYLDEKQENDFPIWTLVLTLIAIFGSLYQVIRAVIKMSKENDDSKR